MSIIANHRLVIVIDLDNAAFDDMDMPFEVARLLDEYRDLILDGHALGCRLHDCNGNFVFSAVEEVADDA